MSQSLIMTLIGDDRPGLVQALSTVVERHGGSWQESRMVRLGGAFAGLLSIDVPSDRIDALEKALGELPGVTVAVDRGTDDEPEGELRRLEVVGQDRPGIVRRVTEIVAELGINIEELETEVASAPMSAELHFRATARSRGADEETFERLQERLEELGAELMVDLKPDGD